MADRGRLDSRILGFTLECRPDKAWHAETRSPQADLVARTIVVSDAPDLSDDGDWDTWDTERVRCMACGHPWQAVFPEETLITALVCPTCGERAAAVRRDDDLPGRP